MKRLAAAALLGVVLTACAQGAGSPDPGNGGLPPLPTGVSVTFPAAPANAYLSLVNDSNSNIVYQLAVPKGKTSIDVDPTKWNTQTNINTAQPIGAFFPAGTEVNADPTDAKLALFHWLMWQDSNANGTLDTGEKLDLMSHDRVAYASSAVTASFKTTTPDMQQTWNLIQGWSRAEHYVYLPNSPSDNTTYQRMFRSSSLGRYTLHEETPITSM